MTGLTLHCILILWETPVYAVISSICTFNTGFGIDCDVTSEFRQFLNNSINVGSGGLRRWPRFTCIIDRPHRCPVIDLLLSWVPVGELHIPNIYSKELFFFLPIMGANLAKLGQRFSSRSPAVLQPLPCSSSQSRRSLKSGYLPPYATDFRIDVHLEFVILSAVIVKMPNAESHPVSEERDRLTVTTAQPQATNRPASIQTGKVLSLYTWHKLVNTSRPRWTANGDGNEGDSGWTSTDNGRISEPRCHRERFDFCLGAFCLYLGRRYS